MICYWDKIDSPLGFIHLTATNEGLIYCASARQDGSDMNDWLNKHTPECILKNEDNDILKLAKMQLRNYFEGKSRILDVPLKLIGTQFRRKVWQALQDIPYGETRSYGDIAKQIEKPKASRAVGQANHHNPISYFVP